MIRRVARRSWEFQAFIPDGRPDDLELAPDGSMAMVYTRGQRLEYAVFDGTLHSHLIGRGYSGSLEFIRGKIPAVAFLDATGHLSYAERAGNDWSVDTVDPISEAGFPSLDLRKDEFPLIAYTQFTRHGHDSNLRLASRSRGGTWETRAVDNSYYAGAHPSLRISPSGRMYIAYLKGHLLDVEIRLASQVGGQTSVETIFPDASGIGGSPSLVLDSGGTPHVAFGYAGDFLWGSPQA